MNDGKPKMGAFGFDGCGLNVKIKNNENDTQRILCPPRKKITRKI